VAGSIVCNGGASVVGLDNLPTGRPRCSYTPWAPPPRGDPFLGGRDYVGMEFFCYHRDRPGSIALRHELMEGHWSYMDRYAK
jgi:hypothetical protein